MIRLERWFIGGSIPFEEEGMKKIIVAMMAVLCILYLDSGGRIK